MDGRMDGWRDKHGTTEKLNLWLRLFYWQLNQGIMDSLHRLLAQTLNAMLKNILILIN
jgi:hypothetical protein